MHGCLKKRRCSIGRCSGVSRAISRPKHVQTTFDLASLAWRSQSHPRLFLGLESNYFVWEDYNHRFSHNVQTREFRDWVEHCRLHRTPKSSEQTLKSGFGPHSLAFGPDDMFCWIAEKDFKLSHAFAAAFICKLQWGWSMTLVADGVYMTHGEMVCLASTT